MNSLPGLFRHYASMRTNKLRYFKQWKSLSDDMCCQKIRQQMFIG